jgi:hypothetical protein
MKQIKQPKRLEGDAPNFHRIRLDKKAVEQSNEFRKKIIALGIEIELAKEGDIVTMCGYRGVNLREEIERRS